METCQKVLSNWTIHFCSLSLIGQVKDEHKLTWHDLDWPVKDEHKITWHDLDWPIKDEHKIT